MTPQLLFWTFVLSTVASLLFSTLSYSLHKLSRVHLEEALVVRRRLRALEAIISAQQQLALSASIMRLVANTVGTMAVGTYILTVYPEENYKLMSPLVVFALTVLISVPVMMVFSVAIPQAWATYAGESLLALTWPVLRVAHVILWPLVRMLRVFDEIVRRLAGVSIGEEPETAAEKVEEEILSMVAEGEAEGAVDEEQKKMIEGVISFRDLQAGQIMTPRTEIVAVDVSTPILEVRDKILTEGLSRLPVFEGNLDNIVGILYAKDLLQFLNVAGGTAIDDERMELRRLIRPAMFVPRTKSLRDLLHDLRKQQVHVAIVSDEYGGTSGLVTTEDILEEIVGDIADEYERPAAEAFRKLDDRTAEVDAHMHITELNRSLGISLPEDGDYQTVGGFVITTLGEIPLKGERVEHEGIKIIVLESEPRRVKKLRLELPAPDAAEKVEKDVEKVEVEAG